MMTVGVTVIGLVAAATIFLLVRRDKLHVNHALGWVLVAALFTLLGLAPMVMDYIALKLGIGYPPTLALTLGIVILTIKILLMDIERSRSEVALHRVTQRLAIQEAKIEALAAQTESEDRPDKDAANF
ncbi:MAG: DUF2304 domain-containing protein [Proteobacteria bacterium]|nr:DUF2304 domain-containing protein [Pseudomonadota bacterium]